MTKATWVTASVILLLCGIMHVHGIFFSEDLYPENTGVITQLRSTNIQMGKASNFWNLWIGFNAMFGAGLIFIGALILYLCIKQYRFLHSQHFILVLTIVTNAFFVWIGFNYMIKPFAISMLVPLILFTLGFVIALVKPSPSGQKQQNKTHRK